ncbi:MAG: glycosyltransferase family 4 protein [Acidimicrobiales bacterium]
MSADAGPDVRAAVASGSRPCPEFLRLERRHGVTLLDWSALGRSQGGRSASRSVAHVARALPQIRGVDAVFSDGEHLGIPLAAAMSARRIEVPHLSIGHHLVTPAKAASFRLLNARRRTDRILVHAANQVGPVTRALRVPESLVRVLPYGIDTDFWSAPAGMPQEADDRRGDLVVAAGREHRDYESLALACAGQPVRVVVSGGSAHSPRARRLEPSRWPANIERRSCLPTELRGLYRQASVVVVPLVACNFPAGITVVLEAMSMAKAVVVSATEGLSGVIDDGRTGVVVPPGDPSRLRAAIDELIHDPQRRRRIGLAARAAAVESHGLDAYVDGLAGHLAELAARRPERRA